MNRRPMVWITGARRGIGAAFAELFASLHYDLALTSRSQPELEAFARSLEERFGVRASTLALDLSAPDGPSRLLEAWMGEFGAPDVLVSNAGAGKALPLSETAVEDLQRQIRLNACAHAELAKGVGAAMTERGGGKLILVASVAGCFPGPGLAAYHASKAFVISLGMALGEEWRGQGIAVTVAAPGPVATGFFDAAGIRFDGLLRRASLAPAQVAREVWKDALAGKALSIPGSAMRWGSLFLPWIPRGWLSFATGRVNKHYRLGG